MSSASFIAREAGCGPKERWMSAQPFTSPPLLARRRATMAELKRILLAEDNPKHGERTLTALDEHNLANEVVVRNDGAEALDYLCGRGKYSMRAVNNLAVVLLFLQLSKLVCPEATRCIS